MSWSGQFGPMAPGAVRVGLSRLARESDRSGFGFPGHLDLRAEPGELGERRHPGQQELRLSLRPRLPPEMRESISYDMSSTRRRYVLASTASANTRDTTGSLPPGEVGTSSLLMFDLCTSCRTDSGRCRRSEQCDTGCIRYRQLHPQCR
jgi:hypothetical protein